MIILSNIEQKMPRSFLGEYSVEFSIRRFEPSDAKSLANLEKECFSRPWSEESLLAEFDKPNSFCFVAIAAQNSNIIGYIGCYYVLDECYIANLAVSVLARGYGIGRALVKRVLKEAIQRNFAFVTLEVRASNVVAINLYKHLGFEKQGIRRAYYSNPTEDAILMTKFFRCGE